MNSFFKMVALDIILGACLIIPPKIVLSDATPVTYPIPVQELEKVLSDYWSGQGFNVEKQPLGMGRCKFIARKGERTFQMTLSPRSPLASDLVIDPMDKISAPYDRLLGHIDNYLQDPFVNLDDKGPPFLDYIPTEVLTRIEAVVCIKSITKDKTLQFSGFIVDPDGLILCTAHNLRNHLRVKVVYYNGEEKDGEVVYVDSERDLALVKTAIPSVSVISLETGRNLLGMGETIYSIGCPINLGGTVFPGIINGPPRRVKNLPYWQVEMAIHPGSSGSPVLDRQGNLVGVVKGRFRGTDSVGFLIPFETIAGFIKALDPSSSSTDNPSQ